MYKPMFFISKLTEQKIDLYVHFSISIYIVIIKSRFLRTRVCRINISIKRAFIGEIPINMVYIAYIIENLTKYIKKDEGQ